MNISTLTAAWVPLKPVSPLIASEWTLGDYRIVERKGEATAKLYRAGETKALAGGDVGNLKHHGAAYFAEEIAAGFRAQQVAPHEEGDVLVIDHRSVVMFRPLTDAARAWFDIHIGEDALWMGPSVAVEHRFVSYVIEGIVEAGLGISRPH